MSHIVTFIEGEELDRYSLGALKSGGLFIFEIRDTKQKFPVVIQGNEGRFIETPALIDPPKEFKKYASILVSNEPVHSRDEPLKDGHVHWHMFAVFERDGIARFHQSFRVYRTSVKIEYEQTKKRKMNPDNPPVRLLRIR